MATASRSTVVERLQRQRASETYSPDGVARQVPTRNVPNKAPHDDEADQVPVQKAESTAAYELEGRLQKVLTH